VFIKIKEEREGNWQGEMNLKVSKSFLLFFTTFGLMYFDSTSLGKNPNCCQCLAAAATTVAKPFAAYRTSDSFRSFYFSSIHTMALPNKFCR
jgi:hypothetical protein